MSSFLERGNTGEKHRRKTVDSRQLKVESDGIGSVLFVAPGEETRSGLRFGWAEELEGRGGIFNTEGTEVGAQRTRREDREASRRFGGVVCASARSKPRRLGDGGYR